MKRPGLSAWEQAPEGAAGEGADMTAREFFKMIAELDCEINRKLKKLGELKMGSSTIRGISYQKDRVQGSGSGEPPYIRMIEKITELDAEINAEIDRITGMKEQACRLMAELPAQERDALTFRYLHGYCWEDVADVLGCTVRHAHRIKNQAFEHLGKQDIVLTYTK